MKFNVDAKQLAAALAVAGKVQPAVPKGAEGYLFSVKDGVCNIYSRDKTCVIRTPLVLSPGAEDGEFVYPAAAVGAFKYLSGQLMFEAESDDTTFKVRYSRPDSTDGVEGEWLTVSPKMVAKCEADMSEATTAHEYPTAVLRQALTVVKNYAADKNGNVDGHEHFQTVQVFDASKPEWAKGDGVLYAANGIQAAYFECSSFKGKHFPLAAEHIPLVTAFLTDCQGVVKVRNAPNMVFFEDEAGRVLGILHRVHIHPKYAYYAFEKDAFSFGVDRETMLGALRHMREELAGAAKDKTKAPAKIRLVYDHEHHTLALQKVGSSSKARSDKVTVTVKEMVEDRPFMAHVNIMHLIDLFDGAVCHDVELRVALIKKTGNKEVAAFRTLDRVSYTADGKVPVDTKAEGVVECTVTRFMPSME